MSMGTPLNGAGRDGGGLGRTESEAAGGERSTEKGVGRARVECAEVMVVDRSMDWNALFANYAWSIFWAAVYQTSRSVSAGHPKSIVAI